MTLRNEVGKFRAWAEALPRATRPAEWECDYSDWADLRSEAIALLNATPADHWSRDDVADLLYAIARDNESEYLAGQLASRIDALLALAAMSVAAIENDAKWQLAHQLGKANSHQVEAEAILLQLVDDKNEYVSRRSLLALGVMKSSKAEALAERAWTSGQEYQRMAALSVLHGIGSAKLADYIERAVADGRQHLAHTARCLRQRCPPET